MCVEIEFQLGPIQIIIIDNCFYGLFFTHTVKVKIGIVQRQIAMYSIHHSSIFFFTIGPMFYIENGWRKKLMIFSKMYSSSAFFSENVWTAVKINPTLTHSTHNEIHKSALLARIRWRIPTCSVSFLFSFHSLYLFSLFDRASNLTYETNKKHWVRFDDDIWVRHAFARWHHFQM